MGQKFTASAARLSALLAVAMFLATATPAAAATDKGDRAAGSLTAVGCLLTDSVSWDNLPPIYEIDTSLNQNGTFFTGGASLISIPKVQIGGFVIHEPALTSPQVIETFFFDPDVVSFDYSATFVFKDRHHRVVATTTSPAVALNCFP